MNEIIQFDLLMPKRIVFGWGMRAQIGILAATLGKRAFLIAGSRTLQRAPEWEEMMQALAESGIQVEAIATTAGREPTIEDVDEAAAIVRELHPCSDDFVLGIGGGAAIDLAKAVAAMAMNAEGASIRDFLEGLGTGRTLERAPLPVMAVPTTSGTGSEATKNAVISCHAPPCKKSLRSEKLIPAIALLDPDLTVSLPPAQTAYSGMDAITQLIESFLTKRAQPATDMLCQIGLTKAIPAIRAVYRNPEDRQGREGLAVAAFASGIALANSGLGMAHGVAAALGSVCDVPHGLACAVMLPIAMRTNLIPAREKLGILGKTALRPVATEEVPGSAAEAAISTIETLLRDLDIPRRLREIGVQQRQIPELVQGSRGNSMNGNPRDLSDDELRGILEANW
jgi:alcohol dehydrogenase class IV